jgi:hypothetical protein
MTDESAHEVRCAMCASRFVGDAVKSGLDNPFRCEVCEAEYSDLARKG